VEDDSGSVFRDNRKERKATPQRVTNNTPPQITQRERETERRERDRERRERERE
jgi:hypothetical protein